MESQSVRIKLWKKLKTVEDKARWTLINGKVRLIQDTTNRLVFNVEQKTHEIKFHKDKVVWTCTCEAFIFNRLCYHIKASEMYLENLKRIGITDD